MSPRTYEIYDINEYFVKFLKISPVLQYRNDEYHTKKYELQSKLLKKLYENEITVETLRNTYEDVIQRENDKKKEIWDLKIHAQNIIKEIEDKLDQDLIQAIDQDLADI